MSTIGNIPAGGSDTTPKTTKAPGQPQGGAQNVETNIGKPQSLASDSVFVYATQDTDKSGTIKADESSDISNLGNEQKIKANNWLSELFKSRTTNNSSGPGPMQKYAQLQKELSTKMHNIISEQMNNWNGVKVAPEEVNANQVNTAQNRLDANADNLINDAKKDLENDIKAKLAKYEALARQEINNFEPTFGFRNESTNFIKKPQTAPNNSTNS